MSTLLFLSPEYEPCKLNVSFEQHTPLIGAKFTSLLKLVTQSHKPEPPPGISENKTFSSRIVTGLGGIKVGDTSSSTLGHKPVLCHSLHLSTPYTGNVVPQLQCRDGLRRSRSSGILGH
ncbi:hypothetical protein UY3_12519 [Chelonia mydas]|uniref:Uncharacterized protein n=1 Tax=Chelonia mydas TaxID=8469 RepID=M7BE01_CHEMY|nr:hypothetical protein UY3_12519 [Chelonia mydas]